MQGCVERGVIGGSEVCLSKVLCATQSYVSIQNAFHKPDNDSEQGAKRDGINPNRKASIA